MSMNYYRRCDTVYDGCIAHSCFDESEPMKLMEAEMQRASEQHKANQMSSPIKDIMELVELSGAAKDVWNAAIEEVLKIWDDIGPNETDIEIGERFRSLKK